jgi:hypothetical protein
MSVAQNNIDEWMHSDPYCNLYIEDDHEITILPPIPNNVRKLVILNCSRLEIITQLPAGLQHLQISGCPKLHTLPSRAPEHLYYFDLVTETSLTRLPIFSGYLEHLYIYNAYQLRRIDHLPSSLMFVKIVDTPIEHLPSKLPYNLINLYIENSCLTHLPSLPDTIRQVALIKGSHVEYLPPLPDSLSILRITESRLHTLPELPTNLHMLDISHTQVRLLPILPSNLSQLHLDYTPISELPHTLPPTLSELKCSNTRIQSLPPLSSDNMTLLDISYTPIMYLRAEQFININIYLLKTHALSIDQFGSNIRHIHFTNPEFQILDLPPLGSTIVSFNCPESGSGSGKITIDPSNADAVAMFESLKTQECTKQKARVAGRTRLYKEDLMIKTWHPSRVVDWCGVNFDSLDD